MTFVGMPTVFYGDELGMQGFLEEEYRRPMPWKVGDQELLAFFRRAIAMRHELPALRRGDFRIVSAQRGSSLLIYSRRFQSQTVTVSLNCEDIPVILPELPGRLYWADSLENRRLSAYGFGIFVDESC